MLTITDTVPAPAALAVPRHIGFIADGNRRWATSHGLPVEQGHRYGAAVVHQVLAQCRTLGVEAASVFLMSDRNFHRPEHEVAELVDVITDMLDVEAAASTGPVRVLAQLSAGHRFPGRLADAIRRTEEVTADRPGMTVCFGIGYDGRADIRQAVARALRSPDYDERAELSVDRYLSTGGLPDLELIVRSAGERRLSGFLLYQAADATMHFDDRYWPDYDRQALEEALAAHAAQQRTFGR
ncbi:polyprenyl diphosphate synthase [Streptomyces brevispora]|uniref:polyprenyl diphosphate synthase n=1 Tax=Streptomyces brevispora TaxID=887462 RepID=UPI003712C152